jgi:dethiobiotin synthetase
VTAFVVTGTDTGIGKTVFAAGLAGMIGAHYWKPVQAGLDEGGDAGMAVELGIPSMRVIGEAYRLTTPCSPHRAAAIDGVTIDPIRLALPPQRPLVIEGAGGALVPLDGDLLFADVFAEWGLPTIVVARTSLGTINHSLLTFEALRARGVPVHGVAFIGDGDEAAEEAIVHIGSVKRLGRLPILDSFHTFTAEFAQHFSAEDFV